MKKLWRSKTLRLCAIAIATQTFRETDAFTPRPPSCRSRTKASTRSAQKLRPSSLWIFPRCDSQSTILKYSIIPMDDAWGNWAVLSGTAAIAQLLGRSTRIGRLLGPPVTAMAMTFAAATFGILHPGGTTAANALQVLALQLATPLILLGANLKVASCGPLLTSFTLAACSTIAACGVGWKVAGPGLTMALGTDGLAIAAALLAKNVGGGVNYIAVCRSLNASPIAVAAGLCVDNIFALIYFPITSALANGLPDIESCSDEESAEVQNVGSISVQSMTTALALSAALLWLGEKIGGISGALPICTLLTVVAGTFAPETWMAPIRPAADTLGLVALYVFFATAGAPGMAVAESVKASLIPLSIFLTCLYSIHGAILAMSCKFFRKRFAAFKPQRLLVASSAAIGGPATAVALTTAAQWKSLAVPSILVGNIGYAIATFCGLAFRSAFR